MKITLGKIQSITRYYMLLVYIKGKQEYELIIKKTRNLKTVSYCYSSYRDFEYIRKSTMGEVHTIRGFIMSCKSQRQKTLI